MAGTAYITFDEVFVPAGNLLGQDGKGLHVILSNFNHERLVFVVILIKLDKLMGHLDGE